MRPTVVVLCLCASIVARADETPCRADGDTVVCQRAGFDTLVAKLLDARGEAQRCALDAQTKDADAAALKGRLGLALAEAEKAHADLAAERARAKPYGHRLAALGLGAVAGLTAAFVPTATSSAGSTALGVVSLSSAATAVVLVLAE